MECYNYVPTFKKYLQSRSKIIELYIVVRSTEAYNRVLVYCAENGIRMTDSRTAFGDVNSERIEYFDVPEKNSIIYYSRTIRKIWTSSFDGRNC